MKISTHWATEDVATLKKLIPLYKNGKLSKDEFVKIVGRSWDGICKKASTVGLNLSHPSLINYALLSQIERKYKL